MEETAQSINYTMAGTVTRICPTENVWSMPKNNVKNHMIQISNTGDLEYELQVCSILPYIKKMFVSNFTSCLHGSRLEWLPDTVLKIIKLTRR